MINSVFHLPLFLPLFISPLPQRPQWDRGPDYLAYIVPEDVAGILFFTISSTLLSLRGFFMQVHTPLAEVYSLSMGPKNGTTGRTS